MLAAPCRCLPLADDRRLAELLAAGLLGNSSVYGDKLKTLFQPVSFQQLCDILLACPAAADRQLASFLPTATVRTKKLALARCSSFLRSVQSLRASPVAFAGNYELEQRDSISHFIQGSLERLPSPLSEQVGLCRPVVLPLR